MSYVQETKKVNGMKYGGLCANDNKSGGGGGVNASGIAETNENGYVDPSLSHTAQHLQCS